MVGLTMFLDELGFVSLQLEYHYASSIFVSMSLCASGSAFDIALVEDTLPLLYHSSIKPNPSAILFSCCPYRTLESPPPLSLTPLFSHLVLTAPLWNHSPQEPVSFSDGLTKRVSRWV